MSTNFRHIDHPLRRGGLSRPERENASLLPDAARLDDRGVDDLLRFWYDFARQVNYFDASGSTQDAQVTGDWLDFFRRSIPFQYASIGGYDLEALEQRFQDIVSGVNSRRTLPALNPLLDLLLEMAGQLVSWHRELEEDTGMLSTTLTGLLETNLRDWVATLIGLVNGAARWGYRPSVKTFGLAQSFGLNPRQAVAVDRSISGRRGSPKNKVVYGLEVLEEIYRVLRKALEETVAAARDTAGLEESLRVSSKADTLPHLGLVFTFLLLFQEAQRGLNSLSERHLDFFYRQILQLKALPPQNDRAHVVLELGKRVEESIRVEQQFRLQASKDEAGQAITFATNEELILGKTTVAEVKTLFLDDQPQGKIHAAPVADLSPAWPTVGAAAEIPASQPREALGFLLSSPLFLLREGEREITVTIEFETLQPDKDYDSTVLAELLLPQFSTEEGWLAAPFADDGAPVVTPLLPSGGQLKFSLLLPIDLPPVVNPGAEALGLPIPADYPALRIDFNPEIAEQMAWYCHLGQLPVRDIRVRTRVCGHRQLILQNDLALLDPAKPFQPFGPIPSANHANFYVGSEELFVKRWTGIDLHLNWQDLPEDITAHYVGYDTPPTGWEAFAVQVAELQQRSWTELGGEALFIEDDTASVVGCAERPPNSIRMGLGDGTPPHSACPWPLSVTEGLKTDTQCGFLRLRLGNQDFLHDQYAAALAAYARAQNEQAEQAEQADDVLKGLTEIKSQIATIKGKVNEVSLAEEETQEDLDEVDDKIDTLLDDINTLQQAPQSAPLPNPPYTPTLAALSLDYTAEDALEHDLQFTQLHPWPGAYKNLGGAAGNPFPLLPAYPGEGHLYVGLADYVPGEQVNLYFELDPATADPRLDKAAIHWSYLRDNEWMPLQEGTQVLSDTTDGLLRAGIVRIAVPTDISRSETTILSPVYHWLRVYVPARAAAIAATLHLSARAVEATFVPTTDNQLQRLQAPLPAETIAKPVVPLIGLKGATQAFPSFGGRAPEPTGHFHRRVSELLRHKGRAITLHDYERLVLGEFPDVYRVKCLTHTRGFRGDAARDLELAPGHVTLVVVPDLSRINAVNPFEPRLPAATLTEIKGYLAGKICPQIELTVLNPEYEPVRLTLCVSLRPGRSEAFYYRQLQRDLQALLAPWTRPETGTDITFGGRFYYSTAVQFVEQLDYIDYVEDLRILRDNGTAEPDRLTYQQARYARSVLTTVNGTTKHIILPANS